MGALPAPVPGGPGGRLAQVQRAARRAAPHCLAVAAVAGAVVSVRLSRERGLGTKHKLVEKGKSGPGPRQQPNLKTSVSQQKASPAPTKPQQPPPPPPPAPSPAPARQRADERAVDMACGAVGEASMVAALYPLDTLKVRCQLSRRPPLVELRSLGPLAFRSLYAGVAAASLGAAFFGGAYMLAYQAAYRRCSMMAGGDDASLAALSGAAAFSAVLANCCTALVEVPLDTARQRLQGGVASGSLLGLVAASAAGGPGKLYAGFAPFLLRTVPMDALQFCVYELLQNLRWLSEERAAARAEARGVPAPLPRLGEAATDMLLGGLAGGASALITMPLDTIKTVMNCGASRGTVVGTARAIWAASGPSGFFAGTSSRLMERIPSCAVYWLAAEATRRCLTHGEEEEAEVTE